MACTAEPAEILLPPVLWNVLKENCLLHAGELCVTCSSLQSIHLWSPDWARNGCSNGRKRMPYDEFMQAVAPVFVLRKEHQPMLFSFDILAVLLHDCHGVQLSVGQWDSIKRSMTKCKSAGCVAQSAGNRRPVLREITNCAGSLDRLDSLNSLDSLDSFDFDDGGMLRPVKQHRAMDFFDSGFEDMQPNSATDDSSHSRARAAPAGSRHSDAASSRSSNDEELRELRLLRLENKALKHLVVSKDQKICQQRKVIRQCQTKASRAENKLRRMQESAQRQLKQKASCKNFEIARVQTQKQNQKKLNQLSYGKLEAYLEAVEAEEEEEEAYTPMTTGWLTPQGTIALALRRNMSNCSAQDLGLVLLEDTSKNTVLRAECKAEAALIASSRAFFERWHQDVYDGPTISESSPAVAFTFLHYREDATNHRQKMMALELHAAYTISKAEDLDQVTFDDFLSIKRLADVVPVTDGTGLGTLAMTQKMLSSLGCPTWQHFLEKHAARQQQSGLLLCLVLARLTH